MTEIITVQNKQRERLRKTPLSLKLIRGAFKIAGPVVPQLAARQAYRLWFRIQRHSLPAREKTALENALCKFIDSNTKRIATYAWGDTGPLVLLVHGWSGRGTQLASFVDPLLKAGYRVVSFDAPAHGKSEGDETSAVEIVEIMELLEKQHGPFHAIVTHSFGGLCAAAALRNGMTAERAVFVSPPATLIDLLEKFAEILHLSGKIQLSMRKLCELQFGKDVWQRMATVENVRKLSLPGLIIHDENDREVSWKEGEEVAAAWPAARFVKTTGLGHRRILRDPAVIAAVINFLSTESEEKSIRDVKQA